MSHMKKQQFADFWLDGFDGRLPPNVIYRSFWALPFSRKPAYVVMVSVVLLLKMVLAVTDRLGIQLAKPLCDGLGDPPADHPLESYGASKEQMQERISNADHYLSEAEIERFEKDGVIGPFRAMSEEEALALGEKVEGKFGPLATKRISPGVHYEMSELEAAWKNPAITHKLASLLGDDPRVWRSQLFPLPPKSGGTFWHQANTFREHNNEDSVAPAPGRDRNIAQLTVWMALTPAKKVNGCMRLLAGSQRYDVGVGFYDNACHKFWRMLCTIAQRDLGFILEYPLTFLGQLKIASSAFPIVRPVFDEFLKTYAKFYEDACEPKTLEMTPGEFIIFTSTTMHASWPNASDRDRLAFVARVAGTGAKIHADYADSTMPLFEKSNQHSMSNVENEPQRQGRHSNLISS